MSPLAFPNMPTWAVAEAVPDDPGQGALLPGEEALLPLGASAARGRDLRQGRVAAHRALARLGAQPAALLAGELGQPLWPRGFLGSIAHAGGIAIAVAATHDHSLGLGVDLETLDRVPSPRFEALVLTDAERAWIETTPSLRALGALLCFSAKEAIYKAFSPGPGAPMDYQDLSLAPTSSGTLRSHWMASKPRPAAWPADLSVSWARSPGFVTTFVHLPA